MKRCLILITAVAAMFAITACSARTDTVLVFDPYAEVDWESVHHVKGNLHTHTTRSDGAGRPHEVVDLYHGLGYGILAITDHDVLTDTWDFSTYSAAFEDRDPAELGMLAITGNELTGPRAFELHDMVALFTALDGGDYEMDFDVWMETVHAEEESLTFFAHPGRYWTYYFTYEEGQEFSPGWFISYFEEYPLETLPGLEVLNRQNRYPHDRALWDRILMDTMPHRPVYGFANDDFHGDSLEDYIGHSFGYYLLEDPTDVESFRDVLLSGAFYISYTRKTGDEAPRIEEIVIDTDERFIEIAGSHYDEIRWYSGIDEDNLSKRIHTGERFPYGDFDGNYVRAKLVFDGDEAHDVSWTLTQPFGFTDRSDLEEDSD